VSTLGDRRVRVDVTENGRTRSIHRTVGAGGSYGSGPLRVWIGLGRAPYADRIEITWPASRAKQVIEAVAADQRLEIVEDSGG
jgi:hypothetical protein